MDDALITLRSNYRDAVRLTVREEILAELADADTARLHADTARFHHGSAHAYAKALALLMGEELNVYEDKQRARWMTREVDLLPMRCQGRRYRAFEAEAR
jgi:hypothetical protein